ncbi:hypothetical protein DSECCO2_433820 [anaerobic digester metagenome]
MRTGLKKDIEIPTKPYILLAIAACLVFTVGLATASTPTGTGLDGVGPDEVTMTFTPTGTALSTTPTANETCAPNNTTGSPYGVTPIHWLVAFGVIVVLFSLPWVVNTGIGHSMQKRVVEKVDKLQISDAEKAKLLEKLLEPAPPRIGLTRFTVMTGVTAIIAAVLLFLALFQPGNELVKTILSVLTGAFSMMIGFYFGGATAEAKNQEIAKAREDQLEATKQLIKNARELAGPAIKPPQGQDDGRALQ